MLRLGVGLVLVGLVVAAQAAPSDEDFFALKPDLLKTQLVNSGTAFLPAYRLGASVVLSRPPNTEPIESGFSSTSQPPAIAQPQQETAHTINSHWHQSYDGDHISLPHLLRVEFNVEQINIALRPHSVSIDREQFKVTLLPHSALIEAEQLKLILQPHSASMIWSKAF